MRRLPAPAKINLALVVGPQRGNGRHDVTTVLQRIDLCDRIALDEGDELRIDGFEGDTLVRGALERLAGAAGVSPRWHVRIEKRIPVAAGLGGGSSDAATALRLANETLPQPLPPERLRELAAELGADVPFFLAPGPQLGAGDGSALSPLELPQDFWIVLVLPHGAEKASTASVYARFDARRGHEGYAHRRLALRNGLERLRRPRDLAALPSNDLASSWLAGQLLEAGAFRADVTGAGPVVYGLFHHRAAAERARGRFERLGRAWLTAPAWYG